MPVGSAPRRLRFCQVAAPDGGNVTSLAGERAAQPEVGNTVFEGMAAMDEPSVDLHDYGPRIKKLAIAAVIGAILTFFSVKAMTSSGRGPNEDPVGAGSVYMLGFAMFVVTTGMAHRIITKKR